MKFIFEWKEDFTSEHSDRVKTFFHEKINLILYVQSKDMENISLVSQM